MNNDMEVGTIGTPPIAQSSKPADSSPDCHTDAPASSATDARPVTRADALSGPLSATMQPSVRPSDGAAVGGEPVELPKGAGVVEQQGHGAVTAETESESIVRPAQPISPETIRAGEVSAVLCKVDLRTLEEETKFNQAESVISSLWSWYVIVGDAFVLIQKERLYKNEFNTFEHYYQRRWGYKHSQVYRLMDAANMYHELEKLVTVPLPDYEALVRPLIGLEPGKAREIWQQVVVNAAGRRISARMVIRQVKAMHPAKPSPQEAAALRQDRCARRRAIREGFDEILNLLIQRAEYELAEKVQKVQRFVNEYLTPKKSKRQIHDI